MSDENIVIAVENQEESDKDKTVADAVEIAEKIVETAHELSEPERKAGLAFEHVLDVLQELRIQNESAHDRIMQRLVALDSITTMIGDIVITQNAEILDEVTTDQPETTKEGDQSPDTDVTVVVDSPGAEVNPEDVAEPEKRSKKKRKFI